MDKIINNLYLGNAVEAQTSIETISVDAIINVSRYENLGLPRKCPIEYFKIGFAQGNKPDKKPLMISAFLTLKYCLSKKWKTLIHCTAGRSRSPAIVILYLMKEWNLDYTAAYEIVRAKRYIRNGALRNLIEEIVNESTD